MNELIKSQLNKVRWAEVPPYTDDTTQLIISKTGQTPGEFTIGDFYVLEIADYILHPADNFTLADNWNKGVIPKSKYVRCQIQKLAGKMINIGAIGYDIDNNEDLTDMYESLWLPEKGVKIIKRI